MPIIHWNDAPERPRAHDPQGFAKLFVNPSVGAERLAVHVSAISPGTRAHDPHAHAEEEVMYVLEGSGSMLLGEETFPVAAECAIFVPSGVFHGIENTGDTLMRYMVILEAKRDA
ncbi:cupin domain-containing protein [Candidatus Poribacteria bacterium]|nr:cupin domain-containing protein [Candidatus Poribacteria bacterium]